MPSEMIVAVPDWPNLDTMARRTEPPVLWPVGVQPLLGHWMDEARRRGASRVRVYCADRPHQVRAWLEGGAYWSCPVEVVAADSARYPSTAEWADRLPGEPPVLAPTDGPSLARWWLDRNLFWLQSRDQHARLLDEQHPAGGWIGPHARVHPKAKLVAPFWIGTSTQIGAGAQIGPGAIIGARCVVETDAHVLESVVLDDTFIGPHVSLNGMVADGGIVIDTRRGCRVEIAESFILSATIHRGDRVPWRDRLLALLLWLPAQLLAVGRPIGADRIATTPRGKLALRERLTGPLLARRAGWISSVVQGRLRLVGPLPRSSDACAGLPVDAANLLRSVHPGVFSVADMHGCHVPGSEEEAVHALYAAAQPRSAGEVLRALPRLMFTRPEES
jgi:carbonic anhydrase/acetyltransferase-like protein (isoleucine patch superfamily)